MTLMYSTREQPITRFELEQLPRPQPMGNRHHPYPFANYLDDVEEAMNNTGIEVVNQEYVLSKDHYRMFGLMEVRPADIPVPSDWSLLVGVRGSHDQSFPRGLTIGTRVLICSNLCFHGNIGTFKTKQTTHIESRLPGLINKAVQQIPEYADIQVQQFNRMKEVEITKNDGYLGLVQIYRRHGFSTSQLGHAIREWDKPTNDYGPNLWTLFNCCTEALKPSGSGVSMPVVQQRSMAVSREVMRMAA